MFCADCAFPIQMLGGSLEARCGHCNAWNIHPDAMRMTEMPSDSSVFLKGRKLRDCVANSSAMRRALEGLKLSAEDFGDGSPSGRPSWAGVFSILLTAAAQDTGADVWEAVANMLEELDSLGHLPIGRGKLDWTDLGRLHHVAQEAREG